jgi:colanic acid/amylovoran biosynthesis glycosyltransferase
MRLAYVTSRFPNGKGEGFLIDEVLVLSKHVDLFIVPTTIDSPKPVHPAPAASTYAFPIISIEIVVGAFLQLCMHPFNSIRVVANVMSADKRPRVIVKNAIAMPKALWLARQIGLWKVDHIHAHWASASATIAWAASLASGVPWSFTAHRWDLVEANALPSKLRSTAFARAISQAGAQQMLNVDADARVQVIRMGVSVPNQVHGPSAVREQLRLLVPANLIPVKGHRFLFEAIGRLRAENVVESCVLAGDGPDRRRLEELTRRIGIQDIVSFAGVIPHNDLLDQYERGLIDAIVLPSLILPGGEQEGVPVSLMEAMAYAVPVIATRSGAVAELVDGFGLLVPPADVSALVEAIRTMTDPIVRRDYAAKGRERVMRYFDVEVVVPQLVDLIGGTTVH